MHKLKGDTLIEVTLAVGIFSMVAVAVVSVVNGSTSSAQAALETTLAREEIDAQAEALRFIQSSYINNNGGANASGGTKYADLWQAITSRARTRDNINEEILNYKPSSCAELYNNDNLSDQGAFIINTKELKSGTTSEIVLSAASENVFYPATTYPHIIYSTISEESLYDNSTSTTNPISRAEGIYIIAVEDIDTTTIVDGNNISQKSAYYDFYIRTCWYGPGADRPSTISTVIRLYNPKISSD